MNAEEIREKLIECPTPWKLTRNQVGVHRLDCGGSLDVLSILTAEKNIGSAELDAVLDMIEMAPVYIETLLAELKSLKEEMAFMGYKTG